MRCPKCARENPPGAQFCIRCHAPLRFVCPNCRHAQDHGGRCDRCNVDFGKYAVLLESQMVTQAASVRAARKRRVGFVRQVALAVLTSGLSLIKYFREHGD